MMTLASVTNKQSEIVKKIHQTFFSPRRYEDKITDRQIIDRGVNYRIPFNGGELAVTVWGETGPNVLLMHGWGGSRAQMTGFVDSLLSAGYRVVAYDQPAHGESSGKMTNLFEIAPSMDLVQRLEGKFDGIIAHSFGTLITSHALVQRNLLRPSRLVYLSPLNRLMDSLPWFQTIAKVPDEIMDGLREMITDRFGEERLDAAVNEMLVQQINIPALMFHDRSDTVTPVEASRAIARTWSDVQYIETDGLGHRGALQSREIHETVINFLKS